jgi:hypothetical protein
MSAATPTRPTTIDSPMGFETNKTLPFEAQQGYPGLDFSRDGFWRRVRVGTIIWNVITGRIKRFGHLRGGVWAQGRFIYSQRLFNEMNYANWELTQCNTRNLPG